MSASAGGPAPRQLGQSDMSGRSRTAVEPHAVTVLAGDDAEAVMLDLVQPGIAAWRLRRLGRKAGRNESRRQCARIQRHGAMG